MKKIVTFGEIMLRLTPPGFQRFSQANSFDVQYGGGECNVAVSLTNFGLPAEYITRLPENDLGNCALMEIRKHNVGVNHIVRGGERLGIYFLEMGAVSRGSKVVYDRAHSGMASIEKGMINWEEAFKDAQWFHWSGITPAISQGAADACLEAIQVAARMGLTVSTDLNHRKNLWKYGKRPDEIMPEMVASCDVVLADRFSAEKHLGISAKEMAKGQEAGLDAATFSMLQQVFDFSTQIKTVATTPRGSISASHNTWTGLLYDGKKLHQAPTYDITDIVDRVGTGDSFMAGLIYGLLSYPADAQQALNFAVAASCLKHTIYGDANLVTVAEVQSLMQGDGSGRVSR